MKKNIILFAALFISTAAFSQVGINTSTPEGVFHIDSKKNNNNIASTSTTVADDVVVSNTSGKEGNVGLGTKDPSVKLEIQTGGTSSSVIPGFKLVDGNQNSGYVLTSDTNGVGTWKPSSLKMYVGGFPDSQGAGNMPFAISHPWANTKGFITLPPGKYRIDLTILLKGINYSTFDLPATDYCFYRFSLTESTVAAPTALTGDFYRVSTSGAITYGNSQYVSTTFYGPKVYNSIADRTDKYAIAQGSFFIENRTTGNKTYYVVAGYSKATTDYNTSTQFYFDRVGASNWSENTIMAFPLLN
ncbi:hypothetical protein [Chryseobacterium sp. RR2-3-20]|uniref:hypothetical protein n=1 Tax=Chryseobacterium sp. RR2-3-20 TaxID=2787626 RepID=UPI001AE099AA|nr:hypothetical protein [Chryseobacterium sp. RR2-3-20]